LLDENYFGEGIALIQDGEEQKILQLTWKEETVLVYDIELTLLETRPFPQGITIG
jgi:glutamine cyclotransferase